MSSLASQQFLGTGYEQFYFSVFCVLVFVCLLFLVASSEMWES